MKRKLFFVLIDGLGHSPEKKEKHTVFRSVQDGFLYRSFKRFPSFLLKAYGKFVGGEGSESGSIMSGYQNIGAGRVVPSIECLYKAALSEKNLIRRFENIGGSSCEKIHVFATLNNIASINKYTDLLNLVPYITYEEIQMHFLLDTCDKDPHQAHELITEIQLRAYEQPSIIIASISGINHVIGSIDAEKTHLKTFLNMTKRKIEKLSPLVYIYQRYKEGIKDKDIQPRVFSKGGRIHKMDPIIVLDSDMSAYHHFFKRFQTQNPCFCIHDSCRKYGIYPLTEDTYAANVLFDTLFENDISTLAISPIKNLETLKNGFSIRSAKTYSNISFIALENFFNHYKLSQGNIIDWKDFSRRVTKLPYDFMILNLHFLLENLENKSFLHAENEIKFLDTILHFLYEDATENNFTMILAGSCGAIESYKYQEIEEITRPALNRNDIPFIVFEGRNAHNNYESSPQWSIKDITSTILGLLGIQAPDQFTGIDLIANYPNSTHAFNKVSEDLDIF